MKAPLVSFDEAIRLLLVGKIGIMPTDTVYGIVASALQPTTVDRLYQLKHRTHKPGTVVAANLDQLAALGLPRSYLNSVAHFWPNPLTVIVPAPHTLNYLTQNMGSLACRIPAHLRLRRLLKQTGPLVTSSANVPGQPTAETLQQAIDFFGDSVDFYCDGGRLVGHVPSTIISVEKEQVTILRQGAYCIPDHALHDASVL